MKKYLPPQLVFISLFLLIFVLNYTLFALAMFHFGRDLAPLLANLIFSALFVFVVFLAIPASLAYFFAFEKEQKERTLFSIATLLLITLVALFALGSAVNSERQTNTPTEEPIATPGEAEEFPRTILTREFEEEEYQLKVEYPDIVYLYKGEEKVWEQSIPTDPARTRDFFYFKNNQTLFLVEGRGTDTLGDEYEQITRYTQEFEGLQVQVLAINQPGLYAGTKILRFYPTENILLLQTLGGDACSGWGRIWKLKDTTEETIQELKLGCANDGLGEPEYPGFTGELLIFAQEDPSRNWPDDLIIRIYSKHPLTGEDQTIMQVPDLPFDINHASLNEEDKNIIDLFIREGEHGFRQKYTLNIQTKELKTIE